MGPDWSNRIPLPSLRAFLGVVLGSAVVGAGVARYAQLMDGSGPILDVVFVAGLWSAGGVLVVLAALPVALDYDVAYAYAISFGVLFGAVSVIGVAYTGQPPSQVAKFGYALLLGSGSALVPGTLAVLVGLLWKRLTAQQIR